MAVVQLVSILLVVPGIIFMLLSLIMCTRMKKDVPAALRSKWLAMNYLIAFFLAGYIAFLLMEMQEVHFPLEALTSTVFLGGAVFVFLVMRLTSQTINKFKESEARINDVNQALVDKNLELEKEIDARLEAERQAEFRLQHLVILHGIDVMITSNLDLKVTMKVFLEQILPPLSVDAADVLLLHPHTLMLEYGAGIGFRTAAMQESVERLGAGSAGVAALERRMVEIGDLATDDTVFSRHSLIAGEGFVGYCAIPLIAKGQVKGVLELFHRRAMQPDEEWREFLDALTVQAAIAIDNATMFNQLQSSNTELILAYDSTIEGWGRALELRDEDTEGHTQRVTEITLRIARLLGMSEQELVHVRRGALLHDIGKMGVPDAILMKEGPLTPEEEKVMHNHPVYAFDLLSPIAYLRPALDIPYCHHERWDGTGYPRGLKGEQIPLAARIFALADIWDALVSERRYHKAWPRDKVVEHIRSLAGTHFDPDLVEVFLHNV